MHALYHLVFTPKFRRAIFTDDMLKQRLLCHLEHIARLKKIQLCNVNVQPDHVHLLIELPRHVSIAKAVQLLKWYTSCHLRREFPELRTEPALWAIRYFYRSVGGDAPAVAEYIEDQ